MHIRRILSIDSSPAARELLRKSLDDGYELHESGTGEKGLKLFLSLNCDAVFIDSHLPDMDGLRLLGELKKADRGTPVIVLTADRRPSYAKKAMDSGASAVLAKPPLKEEIEKIINTLEKGRL